MRDEDVPLFHDADGERCRDVGGPSRWRDAAVAASRHEDAGESLRLLYVALTRAQSQVVAWYCPTANNTASAAPPDAVRACPGHARVHDEQPVVGDDELVDILGRWKSAGGPAPEAAAPGRSTPTPIQRDLPPLGVRTFDRDVDTDWRRTSYSALSAAGAPHAGAARPVLSEPDDAPDLDDADLEPLDDAAAAEPDLELAAVPSPMADLPVGAEFGSLVHEVLEHTDPAAPDLRAELLAQVEEHRAWWAVEVDAEELADALVAVCDSPLGPLARRTDAARDPAPRPAARARLRGAPGRRRPAAARDAATVVLGDLAPLLRAHLPDGDPSAAFAATLEGDPDLAGQRLLGYLTGSIDVVVRVTVEGRTRYLTIDYKTNWLGDRAAATAGTTAPRRSTRRWATPTTRSRRCSTPSCCTATCAGGCPATTLTCTSAACSTSTCAACAGPRRPSSTAGRAGCSRGGRRSRSSTALSDLLDGVASMTDLFEPIDATDARLALGATGLLGAFNAAGVLTSADVHVASALGRLGRESDERVLLAVALAVRAVRGGSVCVDLATVADPPDLPWPEADDWSHAVAASPLVTAGLVRWDNDLLYLDRYHEQETQVVDDLLSRAATAPDHDPALMRASLDRVVTAMQAAAVAAAARVRRTTSRSRPASPRPASGRPSSPAARAPARPPRSPRCSSGCSREQYETEPSKKKKKKLL